MIYTLLKNYTDYQEIDPKFYPRKKGKIGRKWHVWLTLGSLEPPLPGPVGLTKILSANSLCLTRAAASSFLADTKSLSATRFGIKCRTRLLFDIYYQYSVADKCIFI